jgi:PBSX family phage terminase large subunit
LLIVRRGKVENYFYIFGGKDERSQDLIQGITLAGVFFDEVALMPQSFVNQATGRCSVEGSKFWFNCNPDNPNHWFHQEWILKYVEKRLLYLHFTMDDNWSLSEKIKERYRAMYSGAFFQRFILGLWVAAEGVIYRLFADDPEKYIIDDKPDTIFSTIGVDFGGNQSAHAFNCTGFERGLRGVVTLDEFYSKEPYTPTELENKFVEFVKKQITDGHKVLEIYADSAEQVLIRGFKNALTKAGISIPVRNALKGEVNERIRFYTLLIGAGRYRIMRHCTHTIDAFQTALWNPKKLHDERLDDGTTNIDNLDAQEYSSEKYQKQLIDMIILGR